MTLPAPPPAMIPPVMILAGGAARRMGGGDKALLLLHGKPLLTHVLLRLAPQCGAIAINANGDPARFAAFGLPVLADPLAGQPGPLAGVLAAMEWAALAGHSVVVTVAADMPFLPRDLVARLTASGRGDITVAASPGPDGVLRLQPTTALWPVALRHDLAGALRSGMRRMTDFTGRHAARLVAFDGGPPDPFFNVNTPDDLALAEAMLRAPASFAKIAILDWSASGTPSSPQDSKNAIWIGLAEGAGPVTTHYHRTRASAVAQLEALAASAVATGERLLIGADFAFGYPAGFSRHLTGDADALALWAYLAGHLEDDASNRNNHRALAAGLNRGFSGDGPFWANGENREHIGLSRKRVALPPGLAAHRMTELVAWRGGAQPKSVWQLAGAGVVGAQALTGIPALAGLRARLSPHAAVWPFEPHDDAPVVLAEVYPSLIGAAVRDLGQTSGDTIPDRVQVRLLAVTLAHLAATGALDALFRPDAPEAVLLEEGWILGVGFEAALREAAAASVGALAPA